MNLDLVLQILSLTAICTTVALFFCGIPICIRIRKQGEPGDISGVPFLMGVLGSFFWLRYGILKVDYTMIIVNVVGATFFVSYCLFYLYFSLPKKNFAAKLSLVIFMIGSMLIWVAFEPNLDYLGLICMTFNIMSFGAPLAGLGAVLRHREVSSLPLPMCVANFLVSSQWCLYGKFVDDFYLIIPNGIGMLLAIIQLSLFVILPINRVDRSPLEKLAGWFTGRNRKMARDVEKGVASSSTNSDQQMANLQEKIEKLLTTVPSSRRGSADFLDRPPSYKSRSSSVPDISSLQSF